MRGQDLYYVMEEMVYLTDSKDVCQPE